MLEIQKRTKNMKIAQSHHTFNILMYMFLSFLDRWMMDGHNVLKNNSCILF